MDTGVARYLLYRGVRYQNLHMHAWGADWVNTREDLVAIRTPFAWKKVLPDSSSRIRMLVRLFDGNLCLSTTWLSWISRSVRPISLGE